MKSIQRYIRLLLSTDQDSLFLSVLRSFEKLVSKLLAICLMVVVFVAVFDLFKVLVIELRGEPFGFFNRTLIEIFGLFLNILIALELLENITVYLKDNVIQVELVIVTAMIAVARKIIIFDFSKYEGLDLLALGFAILCLATSFWMIKRLNVNIKH
ncbi:MULTISPECIES: phosphate-starvation-inducible PsiE family protein [Synechocystis]|uniref:Phosphate-starvation-inducible PsiE family protein n=1 Tax=Synechocystis salina LEGE 00031 TaxID=1828736 RepID=A0ABR9VNC5_9SYNC|nr:MULTISPECIES: phosphate-starvation-inducible PsiE family protein [Synechocystis]MBD2652906.1 phosphate-starvation-inducible PsiE family protein [Synechocystis sp. FACHB-383]MBE9194678.1 phosphate-starvation-inducible PsiE family protein [Synechocystis sp. LEGE 06083]MBE9240432.1 phosphate-starvation-inducible PsiE family protein [Synechocystis salina LEGE 00041]MBE9252854.1 phosphate-starvation-inducible PsiE family protein [Synechocystis salina LEGE 00031]